MAKKKKTSFPTDNFPLAPGISPEAIARALATPSRIAYLDAGAVRPAGQWLLQPRIADKGWTKDVVYLYRPDGSRISTRIAVGDDNWEERIQVAAHASIALARDSALARLAPEQVKVCDLLSEYIDAAAARTRRNRLKPASLECYRKSVKRLAKFLGEATLAEVGDHTVDDYFDRCRDEGLAFNVAVEDLALLRRGGNEALKRRRCPTWFTYSLPAHQPAEKNPYKPPELDRLEAAALGHRFVDADTMLMETDPATGEQVPALLPPSERLARQPLFRSIIIGGVTGTRKQAMCELAWVNNGGPWIDVDEGVLHRQGEFQQASKNKRRGVCLLPEQLLEILRPMRDADLEAGVIWVLHDVRGNRLTTIGHDEWEELHKDACVPYRVFHALKDTAVQRARVSGVRLSDAAEYFQTTPKTLLAHYGADWDLGLQIPVAESIADTEKWRAAHAADQERRGRAERARAARDAGAVALAAQPEARRTACGATVVPVAPPRRDGRPPAAPRPAPVDVRAVVADAKANLQALLCARRIEGRRARPRGRQPRPWPRGRGRR
jgi:hypothetical protein